MHLFRKQHLPEFIQALVSHELCDCRAERLIGDGLEKVQALLIGCVLLLQFFGILFDDSEFFLALTNLLEICISPVLQPRRAEVLLCTPSPPSVSPILLQ